MSSARAAPAAPQGRLGDQHHSLAFWQTLGSYMHSHAPEIASRTQALEPRLPRPKKDAVHTCCFSCCLPGVTLHTGAIRYTSSIWLLPSSAAALIGSQLALLMHRSFDVQNHVAHLGCGLCSWHVRLRRTAAAHSRPAAARQTTLLDAGLQP